MAIATSTDVPYATTVKADGFEFVADSEREGIGGSAGMRPHDLLDASLAACIAITVRMAADVRGTKLDHVVAEVTHNDDDPLAASFECQLTLVGDLSDKERAGLVRVAHHCPIGKLLGKPIEIGISEASA